MSLSQVIIYQDIAAVKKELSFKPELDVIDEYGYTPLIQTAIMDSPEKAELVLDAGASVDFTDLTGRTALNWAADNGNAKFCQLLLERGANPNSFTRAGQSVLVMPLLKENYQIKQILYRQHANLSFAQDFVNAKLLGHRFDLAGRVDIVDAEGVFNEVEFEGFYLQFTLALLANSLRDFKKNFAGKHLRDFFPKIQQIIAALENATELMRFQHYLVDKKQVDLKINNYLQHSPLILPVAYAGHAITYIKLGSWLMRCDRGEYGRTQGTVIMYRIGKRELWSTQLMKNMLYRRQTQEFLDVELENYLQLKVIAKLPISEQISGNCSWANVEAVIPGLLFLLGLKDSQGDSLVDIQATADQAVHFYEEWMQWDKERSVHFCLESFLTASPARKASKAAILASILFQSLDLLGEKDLRMAERILAVLKHPDYSYILKAYLEVLAIAPAHPRLASVKSYLEQMGVDTDTL
jgi:hypothetical protein